MVPDKLAILAVSMSLGSAVLALPTTTLPSLEKASSPRSAAMAKRSDIDHDAVIGFVTTVPSGTEGTLMEDYWPYLKVVDGCVPFPAVDASGNTK